MKTPSAKEKAKTCLVFGYLFFSGRLPFLFLHFHRLAWPVSRICQWLPNSKSQTICRPKKNKRRWQIVSWEFESDIISKQARLGQGFLSFQKHRRSFTFCPFVFLEVEAVADRKKAMANQRDERKGIKFKIKEKQKINLFLFVFLL